MFRSVFYASDLHVFELAVIILAVPLLVKVRAAVDGADTFALVIFVAILRRVRETFALGVRIAVVAARVLVFRLISVAGSARLQTAATLVGPEASFLFVAGWAAETASGGSAFFCFVLHFAPRSRGPQSLVIKAAAGVAANLGENLRVRAQAHAAVFACVVGCNPSHSTIVLGPGGVTIARWSPLTVNHAFCCFSVKRAALQIGMRVLGILCYCTPFRKAVAFKVVRPAGARRHPLVGRRCHYWLDGALEL